MKKYFSVLFFTSLFVFGAVLILPSRARASDFYSQIERGATGSGIGFLAYPPGGGSIDKMRIYAAVPVGTSMTVTAWGLVSGGGDTMGTVHFPTSTTDDPTFYEISGGGFSRPVCSAGFPGQRFCIEYFTESGDSYLGGASINGNFSAYLQLADGTNDLAAVTDVPSATSLAQYKSDGKTQVDEGGAITKDTLVLESILQSSSTNDLRLEAEVEPFGIAFTNVATISSTPVGAGQIASATVEVLEDGYYHWQFRAVDTVTNAASNWREFGAWGNTDFIVDTASVDSLTSSAIAYNFQDQADQSGSIGTNNGKAGDSTPNGPLAISIRLGKPAAALVDPTVRFYQNGTTGCADPGYTFQGYTDGTYATPDGAALSLANYTDASGAAIALHDYNGVVNAAISGTFNKSDYYAFSFGSCDFSRPISIKGNPGGKYACTNINGPMAQYCYNGFYAGAEPYLVVGPPSTARESVVIVPGVMGTALDRASDGSEVWPNIGAIVTSGLFTHDSYLDDLALDSQGNQIVPMNTGKIISYDNLINAFLGEGYATGTDLFTVPYDWRLDIDSQVSVLAAQVAAAVSSSPDGKVDIIAHSMGGLLVKKYLATASDTSFVDKLILAGVPQLGAPQSFKVLQYGDDFGFHIGPVSIVNPQEIQKISQNMPSAYQLLPSRRYINVAGPYVQDFRNGGDELLDYDQASTLMASDDPAANSTLSTASDVFHQGLDTSTFNAPSVYNIVGCTNPTLSGFKLYDTGAVTLDRAPGDGTVPTVSAMNLADGYANYFALGGDNHMGLVSDAGPVALIREIVDGTTSTNVLPPDISTSLRDCAGADAGTGSLEFSAHGPVTLNAYDALGRHTGPNASGTIDLQIPGSDYQSIGENSFIIAPANDIYRVVGQRQSVSSAGEGTATIKIKKYDAGMKLIGQAIYVGVPLADASATITLAGISDSMIDPTLLSGAKAIAPTALLDASSSEDASPPAIIISTSSMAWISSGVTAAATSSMVFSFTDSGTGIATTSATLNGAPIVSGDSVIFGAPGTSTLAFFAEDNAGNPALLAYDVTVRPAPVNHLICKPRTR